MAGVKRFLKNLLSGEATGWRVARVLLLISIALVVLVMAFEDKLIYFPAKYPAGDWDAATVAARDRGLSPRVEDCFFQASDGVKLHGWYATPARKTAAGSEAVSSKMTLLWFHGNAGNIAYRYDMIRVLTELPIDVFIIDYRGYGRSEGQPSEQGLYKDARAAWDYLIDRRGAKPERVVILGKSLGGAPAIDLASRVTPAGLIIQSSFTSISDMAATVLPFFPTMILRTKMNSVEKIKNVTCRKLFIHSPADEVVPFSLGRRLFEAAPEPKQFYEVAGASHNDTYIRGGKAYLETLRAFIESCEPD
ncbi:MAG TPA: alpha/beta hydrolase [Blastocatellia bacterium]|nr:alpha/beta hydrolase [Blastocatellia bacterium]